MYLVVKETREYWCSIYIYMYMCEIDREKMQRHAIFYRQESYKGFLCVLKDAL